MARYSEMKNNPFIARFKELNIEGEVRPLADGYWIDLNNGNAVSAEAEKIVPYENGRFKPIRITAQVAKVMADALKDPKLRSLDINFLHGIDEDAKPILAQAIAENKTCLGYEIGWRGKDSFDVPPMNPWLEQVILDANSPNLVIANRSSEKLQEMIEKNKNKADMLRALMRYHMEKITKQDCQDIRERMPAITYQLREGLRARGEERSKDAIAADDQMLADVQSFAANNYGITIDLPDEVSARIQAVEAEKQAVLAAEQAARDLAVAAKRNRGGSVFRDNDGVDEDDEPYMSERARAKLLLEELRPGTFQDRFGGSDGKGWEL